MTTTVPLASLISLIPGCLSQFLRFLLQQLIQRFFHASANQLLKLTLPYMDADMRELTKRTLPKVDALTEAEFAELPIYAADEV